MSKIFQKLVQEQRNAVAEKLQMGGDFPQCEAKSATDQDWQHILAETQAEIFEQCRFDVSDPPVNRGLKRRLAILAAICEAWHDELEGV